MRGKRTEYILGCNKYEYFEYIQNKFVGDMSFERFMIDLEIDHIKAIAYRENNIYPSIEDKIRRLHFMNTRPLYREENRRKGWRNLINWRLFSDGESGDKDGILLYKVHHFPHLNISGEYSNEGA